VSTKAAKDEEKIAQLAETLRPVRVVYQDGGQHPDFRAHVAGVSRPDAIAAGPREIVLDERTGKPLAEAQPVATASATSLKPAEIAAAPAEMTALAPDTTGSLAAAPPAAVPFYKRIFSFGKPAQAEPVAATPAAESELPAALPIDVPLPPRRQADVGKPQAAVTPKRAAPAQNAAALAAQ